MSDLIACSCEILLFACYRNSFDVAMGKIQMYEWFSNSKKDEKSINDKPRSRRFLTFRINKNVKKVCAIVLED